MFHIQQLELVHWDYWRRMLLPLDAQIITIVGPNGSGKTTLLDALRTLFALRCSGKRDFRRYVRRADRSFAWIRAVVANRPGGSGRRPFFPCLQDQVTLACRIRAAGGEWTRDYVIADGDQSIEALEQSDDWCGLRDYQNRLAWGGLTPAIGRVLALEQGDTDKLCEYSPRALLELVFDVFGDKEVLDNYAAAREEQKSAERELESLGLDLDRLRAQVEAKRLEADRYQEWKALSDEINALETEIVPRLDVSELTRDIVAERAELSRREHRRSQLQDDIALANTQLRAVQAEKAAAQSRRVELGARHDNAEAAHLQAHDTLRDIERALSERDRLRAQVAAEHGADALALEQAHEQAEAALGRLRRQEIALTEEFEQRAEALRSARTRSGAPTEPEVQRFRARLDEAGVAHTGLADVIEVIDPSWQAALEAILRPYRHVLLLEREADRHVAWALGEAERFRHFIVAERDVAPAPQVRSLAEVLRFSAPVPRWLSDLLNRIRRVDTAEAARELPRDIEWITRDGFHRERRGARHLGRPQEFHFGELARSARIAALESEIVRLDGELKALRPQMDAAAQQLSQVRARLLGLQSAQLLASRADSDAQAEQRLIPARSALTRAIDERSQARGELDALAETLRGMDIELDRRTQALAELNRQLAELDAEARPRRHAQAQRVQHLRRRRRGMPPHWLHAEGLAGLAERYGEARGARAELERLRQRLLVGQWVTDAQILTLRDRIGADLALRERDFSDRTAYCVTARRHTDEARAAYIAKLRATVREYGKNLRALGELANVHVECTMPPLENDDLALSQAGLDVRFDFDRKGAVGLNDGEASGGQQVMKSLILLIGLLMDEARPGGFVFIDEPFAHLDVANIDRVGSFLRATRAQYLITTPVTHNANVFAPAQLTLVTRKKSPGADWAPPIGILQRQV